MNYQKRRIASLSTAIVAVIVVIVIIIAAAGIYLALPKSTTTNTSLTSSSSVSLSSSTSSVSSSLSSITSSVSQSASISSTNSTLSSQELIVDEGSAPSSEDPAVAIDNNGLETAQNTHVPLVFCATADCTTLLPILASAWNQSSDGLTYTFTLRNGVYYSNNDPFNAYAVWYNIYRDLIINQAADFIFYAYFNASGVSVGDVNSLNNPQNSPGSNSTLLQIMQNKSNSVTVLNANTVQFHLTNPFVAFLQSIDTAPWVFVDPYVVQQHGGVLKNQPNAYMSVNGTLVGNGPYVMQSYVTNQYSLMVANPHYWAQNMTSNLVLEPAKIQKVLINYKTDEFVRELDVESGKVQASIVSFSDAKSVLRQNSSTYVPNLGPTGILEFLQLDSEKAPLNNLLVRQAIVAAINLTQIRQTVYNGYSSPFVGPNVPGFFGYNNSIMSPAYNLTLAKSLLAKAGFPGGSGLPQLVLDYPQSTYISQMAQIVEQDLSQIGISVKPQQLSSSVLTGLLYSCCGSNATYPDLAFNFWNYWPEFTGYEFLVDSSLGFEFWFNNQTIDTLVTQSNSQLNTTLRAQEISQITVDVKQQSSFIWLGQDVDTFVTDVNTGPTVFNHCVTGDPGMWQNQAYWVYVGIAFNTLSYSC